MRWLVCLLCAGCSPTGAPTVHGVSYVGDYVVAAPTPLRQKLAPDITTTILYINFDGVTLSSGTDNAPTNVSEIGHPTVPSFAPPTGAKFTRQQGIDSVVDRLRGFYKPFNVQIVTTRPSSGDYTMIAVGGKNTLIPGLTGAAGVSPLDCTNSNLDNVVYDFSEEQPPDYGGLPQIAITAAHESGHSFGLEHTDNPSDIMYSVAMPNLSIGNLFTASFTVGNYSSFNGSGEIGFNCGRPDPHDNHQILLDALGANTTSTDNTPPTLNWAFPILAQVPTSFPVRIDATDNNRVVRVELYKNAEMVAVMTQSPYQATVDAASGESFYLTADVIDPDANRTTMTRAFLADSTTPTTCPDTTCSGGQICKAGLCRLPLGSACSVDLQCESVCKKPAGTTATVCTEGCNPNKPCPTGFTCGTDSLCAPMMAPQPKVLGDSCSDGSECNSMRCQDVCVPACDSNNPCADGQTCSVVSGGAGCVMPSPMPKMNSGGCSTVPSSNASPLFVFLALAIAFAFRFKNQ
jgi:hypothetical protein